MTTEEMIRALQLRGFVPDIYQVGWRMMYRQHVARPDFYQNIEILEGPSSTLYGQGSLAGIVNAETKRPGRP